jgi:hypothetical protein
VQPQSFGHLNIFTKHLAERTLSNKHLFVLADMLQKNPQALFRFLDQQEASKQYKQEEESKSSVRSPTPQDHDGPPTPDMFATPQAPAKNVIKTTKNPQEFLTQAMITNEK